MKKEFYEVLINSDHTPVILKVEGKQDFMGIEIPIVTGGFGEDNKTISDKTISQIHNMEARNVRARITDNIKRFKPGIDFIDLKESAYQTSTLEFALTLGYTKSAFMQAEHIYILSERGYSKLIKIMDSDLAWEIHDKLIDNYFSLKEMVKQQATSFEDIMINQLEEQKRIKQQLNQVSNNALSAVSTANEVKNILDKQMTINSRQQDEIHDAVSRRVYERLERCFEFDSCFDKESHRPKFYSNIWSDLKHRFGVARYRDILFVDFEDAYNFAKNWIEPVEIRS